MQDVIVIGGGVIGLSVARELARSGARVTVLEREDHPRGATWAAGGMLAPLGEAHQPGPFLSLGLESLALWPDWIADMEAEAGLRAGFRRCGKLLVAATPEGSGELRERFEWHADAGHESRWIEGTALREVEPTLAEEWRHGLHLPGHASVDPRRLQAVLGAAAAAAGVTLCTGVEVDALTRKGPRVGGVRSSDGRRWSADVVVVAAGAWSGRLAGIPRPLPVRPVRGQMLALRVPRTPGVAGTPGVAPTPVVPHPILQGLVSGPGAYLIPREGRNGPLVIVGASMEEAGFAVDTDDATIDALRAAAVALVPALAGAEEEARWAGLRPATPDELPILGPDPDLPGLIHATGHHRNGILLAPVTARRICAVLRDGPGAPDPADPFGAARFRSDPPLDNPPGRPQDPTY